MTMNIQDALIKETLLFERLQTKTEREMAKVFKSALLAIQGELLDTEDIPTRKRLRILEKVITEQLEDAYKLMPDFLKEDMRAAAEVSYTSAAKALGMAGITMIAFEHLSKRAKEAILDMNAIMTLGDKGYRIGEFTDSQKGSHIKRFKQIVAAGIAENATSSSIAKKLRDVDTKARQNDINAIVRTMIAEIRSRAHEKAYDNAGDVIIGFESIGTLDNRTSLLCASLDAKVWYKSEGWAITKLRQKNYWYPRHWNCRTVVQPITRLSTGLDERKTRAANGDKAGQVKKQSFGKWFGKQSDEFQEDYLGQGRYKLYKEKRLQINSFIDDAKTVIHTTAAVLYGRG